MADNISLSASMRSNLLALQSTSLLQDMTQDRLATGKKVNSAIDNPTSFFTAQSLNNRASDLSGRLDGIGQAMQTLKAVDKTLATLTKLVEQAKALATQASEAATGAVSLTSIEIKNVEGLSKAATTNDSTSALATLFTGFSGSSVTAGATVFSVTVGSGTRKDIKLSITTDIATAGADELIAEINVALEAENVEAYWDSSNNKIAFAAKEGTVIKLEEGATVGGSAIFGASTLGLHTFSAPAATDALIGSVEDIAAADAFHITLFNAAGTTVAAAETVSITAAETIQSLIDKVNAVDSSLVASFNTATNKIEFTATAGYKIQLDNATGSGADELFGSVKVGAGNQTTFGSSTSASTITQNLADFKEVMQQIDAAVNDASYKGKNLLKGSETMTVLFNEDGTSKLAVSGVNFTHSDGLGFSDYTSLGWASTTDIQTSIDQASAALTKMRTQAQTFGTSNSIITAREEFTKNMVDTLKSGADKLVLADMNEEAANMLALQTQRQLATNSLTMASQAAQSVLQLFR